MEHKYKFNGKINFHKSEDYLNLHDKIRNYFPKDKSLIIEQKIISAYGKGKEKARIEMDIKIITENGDKNNIIKKKLEEILGNKIEEIK